MPDSVSYKTNFKPVTKCYHCGEDCKDSNIFFDHKEFCCEGCKLVFEILNQNGLCKYYELDENPGINAKGKFLSEQYAYLDDADVIRKLCSFSNGKQASVTFYLPQMHCSSCIWLLENLHKINPDIITSRVDFPRKEVFILFNENQLALRKVVELLAFIGYEPHIGLNDLEEKKNNKYNRKFIYKIGVAGFCFGNIMMLSFPEYFSLSDADEAGLKNLFNYLNLGLSLPVFFFSASDFFVSAYKGLRQKFLNIDAPIALSILVTFVRSLYEIISGTGAGYLDSMSGIVFFMLIGRYFQTKTYDTLSFDRDYKSYFPVGVTVIKDGEPQSVPVAKIKKGDRILIRNNELIPVDAILFKGTGLIDYSFVTGESVPVEKTLGEIIYAGGKQTGGAIELEVVKEVSQSYLTQLWNNDAFAKEDHDHDSFIHKASDYLTVFLLALALGGFLYWLPGDSSRALNALTTVLIVACPCALLLSATFTNGNALRILGKHKFYLKNAATIERLGKIDTIVFDKTGTITQNANALISFTGSPLSEETKKLIASVVIHSSHPLSMLISNNLNCKHTYSVAYYKEHAGRGIEAEVNGHLIKLGSREFVNEEETASKDLNSSKVYVRIDDAACGVFVIKNQYRTGFETLVQSLKSRFRLSLLSGDNEAEKKYLGNVFGEEKELRFNQTPGDKLRYIQKLQKSGKNVLMIGDGLNDAGALKQSNVGIAISDNINNFSPSCDAILDASRFADLKKFLDYAASSKKVIIGSFIISLIYNSVGLSYAVSGTLSPVVAAILMPMSSISIILFTTGMSNWLAYRKRLGKIENSVENKT